MKSIIRIILLIQIVFLFSCGEEKTAVPEKKEVVESKEIDVCSMLDKAKIEKILDVEMKEPKKGRSKKGDPGSASFSECSYESAKTPIILLSAYVRFMPDVEESHTAIQEVKNKFKETGITSENIPGIGDVAFWGGNQLHVFSGENYYIIITLIGIKDHDEAIQKSKQVAQEIINQF